MRVILSSFCMKALENNSPLSHLLLDSGSDENFFQYICEIRPIFTPIMLHAAVLVLLCLQESCCYDAILSMRALRPRFHATFGFFPESAYSFMFYIFVSVWTTQDKNFLFVSLN